jgi:2-polyprenyl-3-methyl-5-hydroxy-6-metoxy-1,4-benzoquinol methylase
MTGETGSAERRTALGERLFCAVIGTLDLYSVYLGDRLGLYAALAAAGAPGLAAGDLATRAGIDARYAREWLEQQAATGLLDVASHADDPEARRFRLGAEHGPLLERDAPDYLAPMARMMVAIGRRMDAITDAFRTGDGIQWDDYGPDMVVGSADANRVMYLDALGREWFPAIADVHARLRAQPSARVADLGCGPGWSSIAMARAYPAISVDGFDIDERSIELARHHAQEAGLADRITFHLRDASDETLQGRYDLVTAFECIHDMSRPVEALRVMRGLRAPGGTVIVADENVNETFVAPAGDIDRLFYGFSITTCLPAGRTEVPSAATGTVMRPATLRAYAREAGFADVEILDVPHDVWRFYRLVG